MALSDYAGRSPHGRTDATVLRVTPHRLWRPGDEPTETCPHCGEELALSEKHLLVVLDEGGERTKKYFRDEDCVRGWLDT